MNIDASWRHTNCQSDGSSSLKQPAEKLGDNSIPGNNSSEPEQQETNTAPELEISPSKAIDFISGSDFSGKVNFSSLRPHTLLNGTGGSYRREFNHKQITDTEAANNLQTAPVEAKHMGSGTEVSENLNCPPARPHNLLIDQGSLYSELDELKPEVDAQSKFVNTDSTHSEDHKDDLWFDAQPELEESVVLTDKLASFSEDESRNFTESMNSEGNKYEVEIYSQTQLEESMTKGSVILSEKLTTYSENVSRNFTESMHSEEHQLELEISQSMLEAIGKKLSPILASTPLKAFEDDSRNFSREHFGTLDDWRVFSTAENTGLQHERMEYSKSECLNPTVMDARGNAGTSGEGDKISPPLVDCDALDFPPKTNSLDANLVLGLPHFVGKNAKLHAPPGKTAIESSGQPIIGEEGTYLGSRKKRKSTAESPAVSARVLRSRSKDKPETPLPSNVAAEVTDAVDKKRNRKRKQMKKNPVSEFSRTRNHLKYLLHRIKTEQNFIDAYSSEGWRNQSLEKIKPEKELQRAKSHILHYKLKIRDLFQRLDLSLTEGQIPESLFDSEGEIESEDIFCAKCGSKDVSLDNDIILCDGACERGFHQFCLEPALRQEDIPQGDEGWLCPGCDCKIDCIDLLNDFNAVKLSVLDSWEKVFPEADAAASGKTLENGFVLPSDDSEDDDYDPDKIAVDEEELPDQETSSDESHNTSTSDGSSGSPTKPVSTTEEHYMGLPSEDSEDDDFDPDAPDDDEDQVKEDCSSDFTSDSEDLGAVLQENTPTGDDQCQSICNGEEVEVGVKVNKNSLKDEISYLLNSNESPPSAKRHVERLDYKRLHDETYGNESSDSSDEDFEENVGRKRRRSVSGRIHCKGYASVGNESDIRPEDGDQEKRRSAKLADKQFDTEFGNRLSVSHSSSSEAGSGKKNSSRRLGEAVTQRLFESFKQNQYPKRPEKENLARDSGLTIQQVSKWFENARWSSRRSATMGLNETPGSSGGQTSSLQAKDKSKDERQILDSEAALSNENNVAASPRKDLGAKLTQSIDVVEPLIMEKPSEEKSGTPRTRKRKNEKDEQPPSSCEKFKGGSQVDSPDPKQVRRSSRLQSTSKTDA